MCPFSVLRETIVKQCHGDGSEPMTYPAGIATAGIDIVYVSSQHKLQKFVDRKLKKCVGKKGVNKG